MIAVEEKKRNPKFTWVFVGIYIAPKEYMRVMERMVHRTECTGNPSKRSIIKGDLNLTRSYWNGKMFCSIGTQIFIKTFVLENVFTQLVVSATPSNSLMDVHYVQPEISFTYSRIEKRISDHYVVILQGEWKKIVVYRR
jgi:hypothetical protein